MDPYFELWTLKSRFEADPHTFECDEGQLPRLIEAVDASAAREFVDRLAHFGGAASTRALRCLAWGRHRPGLRAHALAALGRSSEADEYLDDFVALLDEKEPPKVRGAALAALGRSGRPIPFKIFKPFLVASDARLRANAIEAIADRDASDLKPVFELLLSDPAPRVKAAAALALWRMGDPVLLRLVERAEDCGERIALLWALGRTGRDRRVLYTLLESVHGGQREERGMACRSLGRLIEREDLGDTLDFALACKDAMVRQTLLQNCVALDEGECRRTLHARLDRAKQHGGRDLATALSDLRQLPGGGEADAVVPLLDHGDGRVAANAVEVLEPLAQVGAVRTGLLRCFHRPEARAKTNAAILLWQQGMTGAFTGLRGLLDAPDGKVRSSAVYGFGQIGGILGTELLRQGLSDPYPPVRDLAYRMLREAA